MPGPSAKLTDGREICAYVIPALASMAVGLTLSRWLFVTLFATGHRNLVLPGIAFALVLGLGVLLAFLILRRRLAMPQEEAAGFALGLALLTLTVIGLFYGLQSRGEPWPWPPARLWPPSGDVVTSVSGAIGTLIGGYVACRWTHNSRRGAPRALHIALIVPLIAFPIAAVLAGFAEGGGPNSVGGAIMVAFVIGGLAFIVPCLLVTFLWGLLYFRLKAQPAPVARPGLTDGREICAYVLPHLAAMGWSLAVDPWIFSTLLAGHRKQPWAGFALALVLALAVLLAFLHLRRGLAGGAGRDRLAFALGLALLTFIVLTAWSVWQSRLTPIPWPTSRNAIATFFGGSLGTFVGGYAAIGWARHRPDGLVRALRISAIATVIAFPVATLVILLDSIDLISRLGGVLPGFILAIFVGATVLGLPCFAVTFLWSLPTFRLARPAPLGP